MCRHWGEFVLVYVMVMWRMIFELKSAFENMFQHKCGPAMVTWNDDLYHITRMHIPKQHFSHTTCHICLQWQRATIILGSWRRWNDRLFWKKTLDHLKKSCLKRRKMVPNTINQTRHKANPKYSQLKMVQIYSSIIMFLDGSLECSQNL